MIFSIEMREDKFLSKLYDKSIEELNAFFEIKWEKNKPKIFLIGDRKTINKIRGEETENWIVGWVSNKDVYVLDRGNYEKESCHKYSDEEYSRLIKHELAHAYFQILSGNRSKPDWLWEGTAMYVSKQNDSRMRNRHEKFKEFLDYYDKKGDGVYREAGFAVENLVERYGKEKLLELIKSLKDVDSELKFKEKFKKIYGFDLEYRNFQ